MRPSTPVARNWAAGKTGTQGAHERDRSATPRKACDAPKNARDLYQGCARANPQVEGRPIRQRSARWKSSYGLVRHRLSSKALTIAALAVCWIASRRNADREPKFGERAEHVRFSLAAIRPPRSLRAMKAMCHVQSIARRGAVEREFPEQGEFPNANLTELPPRDARSRFVVAEESQRAVRE